MVAFHSMYLATFTISCSYWCQLH